MFRKKKATVADIHRLDGKTPLSWDVDDVGIWISSQGFDSHVKKFHKEKIDGQCLFTLTDNDLKKLGVKSMGHRKAFLAKIAKLARPESTGYRLGESEEGYDTDMDQSSQSSTVDASNRVELAVSLGGRMVTVYCKRTHSIETVQRKVNEAFDALVDIKMNAAKWRELAATYDGDAIIVEAELADPNELQTQERKVLQGLADGAVVIDTTGKILFVNIAFEQMFGYSIKEILGEHVSTLAPPDIDKDKHDMFMRRYMETGNARVIGSGRKLSARHKDGREFPIWLSVSEQKSLSGRHTFLGTMHEVSERAENNINSNFGVLDGVQDGVVVINAAGIIVFFNDEARNILGHDETSLGRNISTWMPDPYSSNHDAFLRSYLRTGRASIIGHNARTVVALRADGSTVPVKLEVGECVINRERFFVGVMVSASAKRVKTLVERTEEVLRSLLVPGVVIDSTGAIVTFNEKALRLFGWKAHHLKGKNVRVLMNQKDAAHHDSYLKRYLNSGQSHVVGTRRSVVAKHKTGKAMPVELSLSRVDDPDDATKFLFTGLFFPAKEDPDTAKGGEESNFVIDL